MKTISIRQPWASLIAHGIKDIENRTWKCPQKYIGQRVLIHASSSKQVFRYSFLQYDIIRRTSQSLIFNCTYDGFPKGVIIGSVVIADCVQNHRSVWAEKGCWHWVLKDPILFENPIKNVKGKLGFWEYNDFVDSEFSERGIKRALKELVERGYLFHIKRGKYKINLERR